MVTSVAIVRINALLVGLGNSVRIHADATEMPLAVMTLGYVTALLATVEASVRKFACLVSTDTDVRKNANVAIIHVIQ